MKKCRGCGYKECLSHYLRPVLDVIDTVKYDITVISNWDNQAKYNDMFHDVNKVKYKADLSKMCDEDFDKQIIKQYNKYDVGLVMQNPNGLLRPPTRLKGLLYAGLPCIAINSHSHNNIWFEDVKAEAFLVNKIEDWAAYLKILEDEDVRQSVSNYNYSIIRQNYGHKRLLNDYTNALEYFERVL